MQEEDNQKGNVLSQSLEKGMKLQLTELKPEQHFTQPPAHYTEAVSYIHLADGKEYPMLDTEFPTIDWKHPYELTPGELDVMERLETA